MIWYIWFQLASEIQCNRFFITPSNLFLVFFRLSDHSCIMTAEWLQHKMEEWKYLIFSFFIFFREASVFSHSNSSETPWVFFCCLVNSYFLGSVEGGDNGPQLYSMLIFFSVTFKLLEIIVSYTFYESKIKIKILKIGWYGKVIDMFISRGGPLSWCFDLCLWIILLLCVFFRKLGLTPTASVAQQFLRCVFYKLAPSRLFPELFSVSNHGGYDVIRTYTWRSLVEEYCFD